MYSTVHYNAVECSAVPGTGAWHNRTGGVCQSVTWHLAGTLGDCQGEKARELYCKVTDFSPFSGNIKIPETTIKYGFCDEAYGNSILASDKISISS